MVFLSLNNPFTSYSFTHLIVRQTAHFNDNVFLPFLVFNIFESTLSLSFFNFQQ